eukprot:XP_001608859.1 hypothetical protein [Babesia bovis T2Bo]
MQNLSLLKIWNPKCKNGVTCPYATRHNKIYSKDDINEDHKSATELTNARLNDTADNTDVKRTEENTEYKNDDKNVNKRRKLFNKYRNIHMELMEGKEYQLHIPPIANFKPSLRKALTNKEVYEQYANDDTESACTNDNYIDGPLDINDMALKGELPDFRHKRNNKTPPLGKSDLFTWKIDVPPDVFVINWSGVVHNCHRDGIITAARAILDSTNDQPREIGELLNQIAEEHKIPTWLSTRARYAQPFIDSEVDWIPALQFYINSAIDNEEVAKEEPLNILLDTNAKAIDIVTNLTEGGDASKVKDLGKNQLERMGARPFELEEWKIDGKQYIDNIPTYNKLLKQVNIAPDDLEACFQKASDKLHSNLDKWNMIVKYRTKCDHLDEEQKQHHEAFNCGILSAIKHHLEVFHAPVYIVSDTENSEIVKRKLKALGIKSLGSALIYGREYGTTAEQIRYILDALDLDTRIPVHYFDDRLSNLARCNKDPDLQHVRTYFVDWGRSTYNEKLGAFYADQ